jgi:hypothetical protein
MNLLSSPYPTGYSEDFYYVFINPWGLIPRLLNFEATSPSSSRECEGNVSSTPSTPSTISDYSHFH